MKKILVILFVLMFAGFSFGQSKMAVGFQGGISLPMGDFGDGYDMGFGGIAAFYFNLNPNLALGLNTGYLTYSGKIDGFSTSCIPILADLRYYFGKGGFLPYFGAGVGVHMFNNEWEILGISGSESSTEFGIRPGLGFVYQTSPSLGIDVSTRFNVIFTEGETTTSLDIMAGVLIGI